MNIQQVRLELEKIPQLKDFAWIQDNYSTMKVPIRNFKDSGKNEYKLGNQYSIFIAHMYEGEPTKEFFYIIMYRNSTRRNYRHRSFHDVEFNKRYVSGNTVETVVGGFTELFTNSHDRYTFI